MNIKPMMKLTAVLGILTLLTVAFQNCSKQFQLKEMTNLQMSSIATGSGIPISSKNCMTDSESTACIYAKSPTAQLGRSASETELGQAQNYGVLLPNLSSPTSLASSDFVVINTSGSIYSTSTNWKYKYSENTEKLAAVSAYYYAQNFKNWMVAEFNAIALNGRSLKIVQSPNTESGYFHSAKEIRLSTDGAHIAMGLDGTAVVGLSAQAMIAYASGGKSVLNLSSSTNECLTSKGLLSARGCCKTQGLCGPALVQGAADYLTALYFAEFSNSTIGETWINSPEGMKHCGVNRNPAGNKSLTASLAFNACADRGALGYVLPAASLYSSVWWEARKNASDKKNFDLLFVRHLALLAGEDTWTSLKTKLEALCASEPQFRTSYNTLLAEINLRGLP